MRKKRIEEVHCPRVPTQKKPNGREEEGLKDERGGEEEKREGEREKENNVENQDREAEQRERERHGGKKSQSPSGLASR